MPDFTLERVLRERRDEIVAHLVTEVRRKDVPPPGLSRSRLVDDIPRFLDELVRELGQLRPARTSYDVVDTSPTARRHGGQRWSLGYDLEALMREYGILRHCILDEAKRAGAEISIDEFDLLAKCLNVGATEAAAAYMRHRDAELAFLSEAGKQLSSSLDSMSILARLARLVVPDHADWCAVYVLGAGDTPVAHADLAKVMALRELHRRLSSAGTNRGAYFRVLRTGEAEFVEEAAEEHLASLAGDAADVELIRVVGAHSWMVLPLPAKDETSGVLVLAYGSPDRRYSPADLLVMQDLAGKVALALENARLYELSQLARSRLETATRAKDEFVAMVSHELRTPLHAILGWLRLQRVGSLPEEKRNHAFKVVERNAETLNELVADLLDFSRIITGNIRLNPSLIDLSSVVESALEAFRPALDAKSIDLTPKLETAAPKIRADGDRVQQVVWNLLSNAVKFTPKGGRIEVSVGQVDSDLELVVHDTGTGIRAEFLPHVFDSFRQWESGSTRRHGGLGIGLTIAKHIVELHGGTISVFSGGDDMGATFTVRFPKATLESMSETPMPATRLQAARSASGGLEGVRVLVVDDDEDALELLRVLLGTAHIEVKTAESAESALAILDGFSPDVLISDIAMPGADGYFLIRHVRTLPSATSSTPAIALTAYARSEDRHHALIEGFNAHLAKPVDPSELLAMIADLAGRPQSAQSH